MRIDAVETLRLYLPFAAPVVTAYGRHEKRTVLFVSLRDADGRVGWGECAAFVDPAYFPETIDAAEAAIVGELAPRLTAAGPFEPFSVMGGIVDAPADPRAVLAAGSAGPMARAAVEMALIDLLLASEGRSLADALAVKERQVAAGASVGMPVARPDQLDRQQRVEGMELLVGEVGRHVEAGFRRVKVKIAPGWDVEPLAALRRAFPELDLHADANASLSTAHLAMMEALADHGVRSIEQPFAVADLEAHKQFVTRGSGPAVCLDESIDSIVSLRRALDVGAADLVCIKPGRLGGISAALGAKRLCEEAGVPFYIGGMYSTALAGAVERVLSVGALTGDIAPNGWRFRNGADVAPIDEIDRTTGTLSLPDGAGIGVSIDSSGLRSWTEPQ